MVDMAKFYEINEAKPAAQALKKYGWEVWRSGGGCSALIRQYFDGSFHLLTCADDPSIPEENEPLYIGFYPAAGGAEWESQSEDDPAAAHEFPNLAAALEVLKGWKPLRTIRLVRCIEGRLAVEEGLENVMLDVFHASGFTFAGLNRNPVQRDEIQGVPKFKELNGPMWDHSAIRYEDAKAYQKLSI